MSFENLKTLVSNTSNFLQFLFVAKILWWGLGGIFGIRFLITYLNYLEVFPINYLLVLIGLIGLIGLFLNKYILNIIFAFLMLFVSCCIGFTFFQNASKTISAGTYFIDIFAVTWLVFQIQNDHNKEKRYLKFKK